MRNLFLGLSILLLSACTSNESADTKVAKEPQVVEFSQGMISTAHPLASKIGIEILKKGGNAFDAAVAVQFALAVVYPAAGNIGGGGFAVYRTKTGEAGSLDFREKAPIAAGKNMYLDKNQNIIEDLSTFGHMAVGVPGSVDGMITLHKKFGVLPFEELIEPAIDLANNGVALTEKEAAKLNIYRGDFLKTNDSLMVFTKNSNWKAGDTIKLPELAATLKRIQKWGRDGFYKGETAKLLLDEIKRGKGIITQKDLDKYQSKWRDAVIGKYKGYKIISMPPPSSGGIALIQLLKGSESYNFSTMGFNSVKTIHVMTELERRVYADRATYLGDPDYYKVPVKMLLDSVYISNRNKNISLTKKTNSNDIKEGHVEVIESTETTHFSIVDKDRNAVSITTTLNGNYGSKVFVKGAGFFLNNEMDDFSAKPGVPNQFGLVGAEANAIVSEKRMLSSMTPTILEKDGDLFMVLGSPGGSTIITSVYQTILNVIEHGMNMQAAVNAKKVHHQWLPDKILYEKSGLDTTVLMELKKMGHALEEINSLGRMDAILIKSGHKLEGGADPRGDDKAIGY